jgi:transcriptional regulator with XRE-family HTH domain
MNPDYFYINNHMTVPLEHFLKSCETYEDFEKRFSDELLNEDGRIGMYLSSLLNKYDQKASVVSFDAHLNPSYVGNIMNGKKNNPSRDALICICFALGASEEELQYLLKYAGHAPLYVRRKRDVIIWFGIKKKESLEMVNDNLIERRLKPLYKE